MRRKMVSGEETEQSFFDKYISRVLGLLGTGQ
jgi:hypothetical protein